MSNSRVSIERGQEHRGADLVVLKLLVDGKQVDACFAPADPGERLADYNPLYLRERYSRFMNHRDALLEWEAA